MNLDALRNLIVGGQLLSADRLGEFVTSWLDGGRAWVLHAALRGRWAMDRTAPAARARPAPATTTPTPTPTAAAWAPG